MVDQFLKRHGFVSKKEEDLQEQDQTPRRKDVRTTQEESARSPAISQLRQGTERHRDAPAVRNGRVSGRHRTRLEQAQSRSPSQMPPPRLVPLKRPPLSEVDNTPSRMITPNNRDRRTFENSGLAGDEESRGRLTVESSGKRHKWIEDIVAVRLFHLNIVGADLVGSQHRSLAILTFHLPSTHHLQGSAPTGSKRPKSPEGQYPLL